MTVSHQAKDAQSHQRDRHRPAQLPRREGVAQAGRHGQRQADRPRVTERERRQRAPERAPAPLLQRQGDGEEPPHARIESVHGAESHQRRLGADAGHAAKQNESEDASPPASLTW